MAGIGTCMSEEKIAGRVVKSEPKIQWIFCRYAQTTVEQRYVATATIKGQRFKIFKCECSGKEHYNRLYDFGVRLSLREVEMPVFHGRSIFGQKLIHL